MRNGLSNRETATNNQQMQLSVLSVFQKSGGKVAPKLQN